VDWLLCDFHFISGDMNTRTAASALPNQRATPPRGMELHMLKQKDELVGMDPFGRDIDWNSSLLNYINALQKNIYTESKVTFPPSYKLTSGAERCRKNMPCYRTDRPKSWTDRIIHSRGKSIQYNSINLFISDHLPVFEEFELT